MHIFKTQTLSWVALLLPCILLAQQPNLEWVKQMGGSQGVIMVDVVTDLAGNTYSTATFMGSVDLDPDMMGSTVLTSEGSSDIFIQKRDPNGNLLWAAHTGGNSWDSVHALVVDNSGNVYVAGRFNATADFDPGPGTFNLTSEGENDSTTNAFIWKLDGNGNLVWVKQLSSVGSIGVNCMDIDGGGNVYVSGSFRGTADFDPGPGSQLLTPTPSSPQQTDVYILKLNANGDFVWVKQIGNADTEEMNSLAAYENGDIIFTGLFYNTVDVDPGNGTENFTSNGQADIFIEKLNSNGDFLWAKQLGGVSEDVPNAVSITSQGDVLLAGLFQESIDLNPSPFGTFIVNSNGGTDIFVDKFDENGDLLWGTTGGGLQFELVWGLETDASGDVFISGATYGANNWLGLGANPLIFAMGERDIFVTKLSTNANHLWTRTFGGTGIDEGTDISIDESGNLFVVGYFDQTVIFDPGAPDNSTLTSLGASDGFILKLEDSPITYTSEHPTIEMSVFPNPTKGDLVIDLGAIKDKIEIEVIDAMGRTIASSVHTQENLARLYLPGSDSIYFLRINVDGLVYTTRVFKN